MTQDQISFEWTYSRQRDGDQQGWCWAIYLPGAKQPIKTGSSTNFDLRELDAAIDALRGPK